MTTQTRHGVFETNSSSTHSISICHNSNGVYDTLSVDENGVVHLTGGKFGWEEETYYYAEVKANYCAIYALNLPDKRDMLVEVIKEVTDAKEVAFDFSLDWGGPNWSYIDHQSSDVPEEAFSSKETLKDFIFNCDSCLVTDNDNH
jgi:hypothetical protein